MNIKPADIIYLTSLSKLIKTSPFPWNSESVHLMARSLNNGLNLCIKYIDKEPVTKSPFPPATCPKCHSGEIFIHKKAGPSFYCSKCLKTYFISSAKPSCPKCKSKATLIKVPTSKVRYKCKNCNATFVEGAGIPTDFNKFIHFSYLIYNTEFSYNEIIGQLKISSDTYYRWKKRLAVYYPNTRAFLYTARHKK